MTEWTQELVDVRLELGDEEVVARANKLGDYQRYDSVNTEGMELTPAQVTALAALAKSLGPDVVIYNGGLKRIKSLDERCMTVVRNEVDKRRRAVGKAAYDGHYCPDCGTTDVQAQKGYNEKCPACDNTLPYYPYG